MSELDQWIADNIPSFNFDLGRLWCFYSTHWMNELDAAYHPWICIPCSNILREAAVGAWESGRLDYFPKFYRRFVQDPDNAVNDSNGYWAEKF